MVQPVSVCQDGFGSYSEQPDPEFGQTVSVQVPLSLPAVSRVPPTAVTYCDAAG